MTIPSQTPRSARASGVPALPDFSGAVDSFVEAQRLQSKALLDWQESLLTFNKDFWEQWAYRYAGGAPFGR
jgi:hypothetical protein